MFASQETQRYRKTKLSKRQEFRFNIRKNHIDNYMAHQRAKLIAQKNRQLNHLQQSKSKKGQKNQKNIRIIQKQINAFLKDENSVVPKLVALDFRKIYHYQQIILSNEFQQKLDALQISNIKYMSKVISMTDKLHYHFIENYLKAFKGQEGQNLIKKIVDDQKDQNSKQKSIDFCAASIELFNCYLNKFMKQKDIDHINQQASIVGISQEQIHTIIGITCQFWNGKVDVLGFAELVSNICRFRINTIQNKLAVIIDSLMYQNAHFFILEAVCFAICNFKPENMLRIVLNTKFMELISRGFEMEDICKIKAMAIIRSLLYNQNVQIQNLITRQIPLFKKLLLQEISKWDNNNRLQQQLLDCTNVFGQLRGEKVVDFLMQIDFMHWFQHLSSQQLKLQLLRTIKNVLEAHLQSKELFIKIINQPQLIKVIQDITSKNSIIEETLFELAQIIVQQFQFNQVYPGNNIHQQIAYRLKGTEYAETQIYKMFDRLYQHSNERCESII